jgi:predicted dehydrogenase
MSADGKVAVAVVGLGGMGWRHAETLRSMAGVELRAVADLDADRRAAAHERWEVATYSSWEDLLEREPLDALFVSTPPLAHAAPALAALERQLAVFVEKPIARHLDEANALVEAQRRSGAVAAVGYQWRAVDFVEELREAVGAHRLGLLAGRSIGPARLRPWFTDWAQGGGVLLELASHDIDLQRAIAGEVVSVQAAATDVPIAGDVEPGVPSVLSITLRFRYGALGAVQVAWLARGLPPSWALDVVTDRAAYYAVLDPHFTLGGMVDGRTVSRAAGRAPAAANVARFVGAVRAGDPGDVFCDLADGARTLAVTLACEDAIATGETVTVGDGVPT